MPGREKSRDKSRRSDDENEKVVETNYNNNGAPGINAGRWTREEHNLFLQGLEAHGKEWKKISDLIQTRTVVQIRTHAQKYFQKVAKHTGGPVMSTSKKEVRVKPATRKKKDKSDDLDDYVKPSSIRVPTFKSRRTRSLDKSEGAGGGATPRTIAAATILLAPRIQNKLQAGGDTPKTRETAAWLAAHQESAEETLGKRRRGHHSPRMGRFAGNGLSWDTVTATATK